MVIANESDWNAEYFASELGHYRGEATYHLALFWGITSREAYEQRKANYERLKENTTYFQVLWGLELQKSW